MPSTPVRVLLVDDHPVMRDGLQQLLERTGEFEVVGHAGDGEEAERMAKELVPDLVIMDVLMPRRDGIEACREIMDALPDIRVLILTASTERNAVIEAVAAGADGYLQKFTGTEQLLATVRDVARGEYRMPRDVMKRVFRRLRNMPEQSDSPKRKGLTSRGKRDTHPVREGDVVLRHCRVQGQPVFDDPQRHLRHTEQAGIRQQAGGHRLGCAKRPAGLKPEAIPISDSAQNLHA